MSLVVALWSKPNARILATWYLCYSLSYRDLEEMMIERGISVDRLMNPNGILFRLRKGVYELELSG